MNAIQLEFNLDDESELDVRFSFFQKQIDVMNESMGKVRRRLFFEVGEMKKICAELKIQNQELQVQLRGLTNEKTEWVYGQNGCLFDVRKSS